MSYQAVIGYVHGGLVRAEFCASMLAAMRSPLLDEPVAVVSGPNVSEGRNLAVARFLNERDAPWLLMVDTDMVFAPDAPARLISAADPAERPVVGALCYLKDANGDARPMMYDTVTGADGQPGFIYYRPGPDDGCVRVAATGAAFLLMHRQALEKIRAETGETAAPWFRESVAGDSLIGEDMTFCLRAAAAGIPVHVDTRVQVGHVKSGIIGKVT